MNGHARECDCDACFDMAVIYRVGWCLNAVTCGKPRSGDSDFCEECEGEEAQS